MRFLESDEITNFEGRMVAEVKLYWIIYEKCCGPHVDLTEMKANLQAWKQDWATLFGGFFHFATICETSPRKSY
jgi:hypothetical protein